MLKILGLLSGGAGPWVMIGVVVACLAAGGVGGWSARGVIDAPKLAGEQTATAQAQLATQQCVAAHEKGRADSAEQVLSAMNDAAHGVTAALDDLNKAAKAHAIADNNFNKELAHAPISSVCAGSDAERAYRNSVRSQSAPAPTP